jgi:hypothetical protein
LSGAAVSWTSSAPSVVSITGSNPATATALANGTATLTATAGAASASVNVTVSQVAVTPAKLAGDAQSATVGAALTTQVRVRVADRLGNLMAGSAVSFAAATGSGSVSPATATSGVDGTATATWTLGTVPGAQTLSATVAGGAVTTFTATALVGPPASVTVNAGNGQSAVAGSPVAISPAVRVADTFNNPVPNVAVTFAIGAGGGSVSGATATTNASGIATLGGWTLGTAAGAKSVTATVAGLTPATFTATAVAGPAAAVSVSAGNAQTAQVSTAVATAPAVRVDDANGNPVSGVAVTFAVGSGGGSVTGGSATTSSNGIATAGSWVLGATAGANTLTATAAGTGLTGNPVTFTATGSATPPPAGAGYNIELRFVTTGSATQVAAFNAAAARWQSIITADLSNVITGAQAAGTCGTGTPAFNETIDDLVIFVSFVAIDGPGNVLGSAGPCLIRNSNSLTVVGTMRFDTADLATMEANGSLNSVILHEMGHVLGIGTLWSTLGLLADPSLPSSPGVDTRFTGANGIAGFNTVGGSTYTGGGKVPVENTQGGAGTRDGHWRESVLQNELMTGFLNSGVQNPLSVLTIRSLTDLGYTVSVTPADPFFLTLTANAKASPGPVLDLGDDILRLPISVIDDAGRVVRVIRPPRD